MESPDKTEDQKKTYQFQQYYLGGDNFEKTESLFTLTLFYMAQAYTKLDNKGLAAQYCGDTMKR